MGEVKILFFLSVLLVTFLLVIFLIGDFIIGQVMVELEGMDLSGSETCPLSLAREITPRKVSSWSMLLLLRIISY